MNRKHEEHSAEMKKKHDDHAAEMKNMQEEQKKLQEQYLKIKLIKS